MKKEKVISWTSLKFKTSAYHQENKSFTIYIDIRKELFPYLKKKTATKQEFF